MWPGPRVTDSGKDCMLKDEVHILRRQVEKHPTVKIVEGAVTLVEGSWVPI